MVLHRSMRTGSTAVVLMFGLISCAGGDSISGTYECLLPGTTGEADVADLAEDGTLTITLADGGSELRGTWSVDGDQGMFVTPDFDEPFTVVDGRLVFADTTECTKTG